MWLLTVLILADTATRVIVVAPGESLAVHDVGAGPPVVLLPGLFGSAYGYRNVVRSLRDEGYRSITIELLGVGRSSRPRAADYSLAVVAGRIGADNSVMHAVYPLDPSVPQNRFVAHAALQFLYFGAWEVLFRGALLFGLRTGSIWYIAIIHWTVGISMDWFILY
jgi:pimeloyl-ACP methyl ester carboxylesterase